MCRIESYNLNFPDGHSEPREHIVNCPRGTPNNPCHRREYVTLFRDREATQEDIAEHARRNALVIQPRAYSSFSAEPRHTQESGLARRKNHQGVLGGLELEFKLWNPFSSKRKEKKRMARRTTYRQDTGIDLIERMPRAPSPPPAVRDPRMEPRILEAMPRKETEIVPERRERSHRRRRRRHRRHPVVLHQETHSDESSSEDDDEDSSPSPTRPHHPPRPRSPSPGARAAAAAEKAAHEQRGRDDRIAEAEREARRRGERQHEEELRRERRRRVDHPDQQRRLETPEEHARRQYEEDSQIMRARRHQDAHLAPGADRRTQVHQHRRNISFEEVGDDFIEGAVEEARRRRESSNTSNDGSHNSGERGHERRRHGGSH